MENLQWDFCYSHLIETPLWYENAIGGFILLSLVVSLLLLALLLEVYRRNDILEEILPKDVISHLKKDAGPYSEAYKDVTILFCDIVSFTPLCGQLEASEIVSMLDDLYTKYDSLCQKHGIYKVETIGNENFTFILRRFNPLTFSLHRKCDVGDAYMCVAGCPKHEDPTMAALRMVGLARDIIKCARTFKKSYFPVGFSFQVRIVVTLWLVLSVRKCRDFAYLATL